MLALATLRMSKVFRTHTYRRKLLSCRHHSVLATRGPKLSRWLARLVWYVLRDSDSSCFSGLPRISGSTTRIPSTKSEEFCRMQPSREPCAAFVAFLSVNLRTRGIHPQRDRPRRRTEWGSTDEGCPWHPPAAEALDLSDRAHTHTHTHTVDFAVGPGRRGREPTKMTVARARHSYQFIQSGHDLIPRQLTCGDRLWAYLVEWSRAYRRTSLRASPYFVIYVGGSGGRALG